MPPKGITKPKSKSGGGGAASPPAKATKETLSNDEFFTRLTTIFDSRRQSDHGSVFLTQKRCWSTLLFNTHSYISSKSHLPFSLPLSLLLLSSSSQLTTQHTLAKPAPDNPTVYYSPSTTTSSPTPPSDPTTDLPTSPTQQYPLLIRATNGHTDPTTKSKAARLTISTIVAPEALDAFFSRYAEVCKLGMSGLKKRDRSKGKKKLRAKKKKKVVGGVGGTGTGTGAAGIVGGEGAEEGK